MNRSFTRYQKLPDVEPPHVSTDLVEAKSCIAAVPAASSRGVSPLERTRGETPHEPAGEDARATTIIRA